MTVAKKKPYKPWPKWFEEWFNRQWDGIGLWDKYDALRIAWRAYCKGRQKGGEHTAGVVETEKGGDDERKG
jgi:hypothetical protein